MCQTHKVRQVLTKRASQSLSSGNIKVEQQRKINYLKVKTIKTKKIHEMRNSLWSDQGKKESEATIHLFYLRLQIH